MEHPDYNSAIALKTFLEENGMAMQKKFGQNFMLNPQARTKIIDYLDPEENQVVWEIGPGLGCMTSEILSRKACLTAFEIDRGFISFLHQFFDGYESNGNFRIVEGDVLKTWKKEFECQEKRPCKLFGNLPYNIAATFIADTITEGLVFDKCVFTIQKEVAQRMVAKPSSENYSSFSVLCQWGYEVKPGLELAAGNFWPKPNVGSQAVVMTRREKPYECSDPRLFVKLVHALFLSRRKTVNNNIKGLLNGSMDAERVFSRAGIDKSQRAENLHVEDFLRLCESLRIEYDDVK